MKGNRCWGQLDFGDSKQKRKPAGKKGAEFYCSSKDSTSGLSIDESLAESTPAIIWDG
jgi:hypothetical protein